MEPTKEKEPISLENRFLEMRRKNFKLQDGIAKDLKEIKKVSLDNQAKIAEILELIEFNF